MSGLVDYDDSDSSDDGGTAPHTEAAVTVAKEGHASGSRAADLGTGSVAGAEATLKPSIKEAIGVRFTAHALFAKAVRQAAGAAPLSEDTVQLAAAAAKEGTEAHRAEQQTEAVLAAATMAATFVHGNVYQGKEGSADSSSASVAGKKRSREEEDDGNSHQQEADTSAGADVEGQRADGRVAASGHAASTAAASHPDAAATAQRVGAAAGPPPQPWQGHGYPGQYPPPPFPYPYPYLPPMYGYAYPPGGYPPGAYPPGAYPPAHAPAPLEPPAKRPRAAPAPVLSSAAVRDLASAGAAGNIALAGWGSKGSRAAADRDFARAMAKAAAGADEGEEEGEVEEAEEAQAPLEGSGHVLRAADLRPTWNPLTALAAKIDAAASGKPLPGAAKGGGLVSKVWNAETGTAEATAAPTNAQRQKHQINYLAAQAAARIQAAELDPRLAGGGKAKAASGSRYGW